jgi:hypothetical protein
MIYFSCNSSRKSVSMLFKKFPAILWNPTTCQQICRRLNLILSKFRVDHHLFHLSSLPLQNCVHALLPHAYYMSFLSCSSPLLNHTIKVIQHSKNMKFQTKLEVSLLSIKSSPSLGAIQTPYLTGTGAKTDGT